MAGPCCGLRGNLDVLEGNLVPTSRKEKREHFKNFANHPQLTGDDQIIGPFKSHRTLAAVTNLQPPRYKSVRKNIARALPPSGHLPFSNLDSQKRSIAVQQPSLKASANRRVPVHFDDANKTINKNRMLKHSSDVMNDISYVSDGIAAQRCSLSQSKEMPISQAVNSYPRQTFLVPNNGRQHLTRKEKKRIEDTHTNLHIPDTGIGNGISPTVVIDRRTNNIRYRHKQSNSCDDHEVNEREIDGNTCLSSFTFSSTSSSFSSRDDDSSSVQLCPNGKKPLSRSLSSESTTSKLLPDDNKHILAQNGLPTATCTILIRGNPSKQTEYGRVPESVAATFSNEKDIQADKVNDEELVFSIHDPKVQSNEHTFVSYKLSKTEGKEMNFNYSDTTSQRQLTQNQHSLVVNAEKCETPCNKIDGSTSLNCAYTHVGKRSPRKSIFKLQKSKRPVQNSSSVGLMCGNLPDTTLHLGVGIGILYMLVASRKEVERLSDLLEQTNSLVQEMKRQFQCEAGLSQSCSSKTGNLNMERPESQKHKAVESSQMLQDDLIFEVCNGRLKPKHQNSDMIAVESNSEHRPMAELEAALEAELELMQRNLASESFFSDEAGTEDFSEWMSLLSINEPSGPDDRSMKKFDEDDKRLYSFHEELQDINFAVSPDVLCMRLHEVLETKQEDQILELEAQLEATKNRLAVKERELQSWKDIFHRLIKLSHGNSGDDAEIYIINKRNSSFSVDMEQTELNAKVEERWETRSS